MATDRERFKIVNTLVCLVKSCEGFSTTVDLRNETSVSGKIETVDGHMNISMSNVVCRNFKGKVEHFENFFIHGKTVRFVHIPDEIDMRKAMEKGTSIYVDRAKEVQDAIMNAAKKKMAKSEENYKKLMAAEKLKSLTQTVKTKKT